MKNIQFIDGADNCTYSIYSLEESIFIEIFPKDGQDIEFTEDVVERVGKKRAGILVSLASKNPIYKTDVNGIHGTLFFQLKMKSCYYPTKKEAEFDQLGFLK